MKSTELVQILEEISVLKAAEQAARDVGEDKYVKAIRRIKKKLYDIT